MSLESVYIPEKKSLIRLAQEKGEQLSLGRFGFGPRAAENIPSKFSSAVLNLISASAHNDWLRQKIIVSLHGEQAELAYERITESGTKTKIEQEKRYINFIRELSIGDLQNCLIKVYNDAKRVSALRNTLAHGIFGYAENLEEHFLVFEPAGLTEAHARYHTFEHTTNFFVFDPTRIRTAFDASLPDPNKITVWNAELLDSALNACQCVGRSLNILIETMRPNPHAQFSKEEVYCILAHYGTTSIDLEYYFALRFDYKFHMEHQRNHRQTEQDLA